MLVADAAAAAVDVPWPFVVEYYWEHRQLAVGPQRLLRPVLQRPRSTTRAAVALE